jgi:acyl dehydratase
MGGSSGGYFDDLEVGRKIATPTTTVSADDIVRFAREFDPQPYHLDHAAALGSPLKGLAASGWHTAALLMRLLCETRPFGPNPLLGLGVDELRWLAPVRPGDELHAIGEVLSLTPSTSRPDRGTVRIRWTLYNQRDEPVYSAIPIAIVPRRPA